jgi:hypothetical protein
MHNYIYNSSSPLLVLVGRNEVNSNEVNLEKTQLSSYFTLLYVITYIMNERIITYIILECIITYIIAALAKD